jgi:hypothetical protein
MALSKKKATTIALDPEDDRLLSRAARERVPGLVLAEVDSFLTEPDREQASKGERYGQAFHA